MMNIQGIMKQAQMMQKKMQEAQEKLAQTEVVGESGAGLVKVVMTGKSIAKKVEIDKSLLVPDDVEMLEDLIVAACNDAQTKVEKMMSEGMQDVTGGLNLGGMKLPF